MHHFGVFLPKNNTFIIYGALDDLNDVKILLKSKSIKNQYDITNIEDISL